MKRFVKPKGFEDFEVIPVELSGTPDLLRIYDIERRVIWINTAAREGANIIALEPKRL